MKPRALLVSIAIAALIVVPAVRCVGDVDYTAVDRFFTALRDGKFSAATAHFSIVMQAALPAEVLGAVWTKRDEVATARTLDVPILILHGGRDYQVIYADIQLWQTGLKGVARVRFEDFPALNHLFIAGVGKPGPAEHETAGHVDAGVVGAIAEFIQNASAHK
jgi:pimeloyl-ACP methyl ester carboxylesterase